MTGVLPASPHSPGEALKAAAFELSPEPALVFNVDGALTPGWTASQS